MEGGFQAWIPPHQAGLLGGPWASPWTLGPGPVNHGVGSKRYKDKCGRQLPGKEGLYAVDLASSLPEGGLGSRGELAADSGGGSVSLLWRAAGGLRPVQGVLDPGLQSPWRGRTIRHPSLLSLLLLIPRAPACGCALYSCPCGREECPGPPALPLFQGSQGELAMWLPHVGRFPDQLHWEQPVCGTGVLPASRVCASQQALPVCA